MTFPFCAQVSKFPTYLLEIRQPHTDKRKNSLKGLHAETQNNLIPLYQIIIYL